MHLGILLVRTPVLFKLDATFNSRYALTHAEEKIYNLCANPLARELRAVQERAFLTVPFSGSTLGVRVSSLAFNLAEAMTALTRGAALPSLQFSSVALPGDNGVQAVAKSGVKVYTSLPVWNGTDLDTFCPGTTPELVIADLQDEEEQQQQQSSSSLEGWAIGLPIALGLVAAAMVAFLGVVVSKERSGKPMFLPVAEQRMTQKEGMRRK